MQPAGREKPAGCIFNLKKQRILLFHDNKVNS